MVHDDALAEAGVEYETVCVEALHSARDEVRRVSGKHGMPVLVDGERDVTMAESEQSLRYVERTLADG